MRKKKLCEVCKARPATVPDRTKIGRLIDRLCEECHVCRLAGDLRNVLRAAKHKGAQP